MKKSKIATLVTSFLIATSLQVRADEKLDGHWEGNIEVLGTKLDILVDIDSKDENNINATIDIPQQGAKGLVLKNIIYKEPNLIMQLKEANNAEFKGQVSGDTIKGDFSQSGYVGTFKLAKKAKEKSLYREEEVNLKHGDVNLSGTLSFPNEKKENYPAILLITGSGQQTRDEEIFGFKIFKIIADHLNKNGIAVLRLDDRGAGKSKGGDIKNSTTLDFVTDAEEGVKFLVNHKEIDKKKIGLLGHSEGGIIAPILAQKNKNVSFMILMAGTSETGEKILSEQNELISKVSKIPEDKIKQSLDFQKKYFKALKTNEGWEDIEKALRKQILESIENLPKEAKKNIKDINAYTEENINKSLESLKSNWLKFFIEYDPLPVLKKTKIPTLALFGEKDLQVPSKTNAPLMESALKKSGNKQYLVKVLPNANHLFQNAKTGSPEEYSSLEKSFVPEFLDTISDWISKNI
ncbi:MAG: alpha/beta fold hydrolase [Candidatus Sericytochromatia bacterium]